MKTTYKEFIDALKIVNNYKNTIEQHYNEVEKQCKEINKFASVTKDTLIYDIEYLDLRTKNALFYYGRDIQVKDLESTSIKELKKLRNFGAKSLNEIKEICFYAGVNLLP